MAGLDLEPGGVADPAIGSVHRGYYVARGDKTIEIFFQHERRNFVSPSGHVMFYLLYKHQ